VARAVLVGAPAALRVAAGGPPVIAAALLVVGHGAVRLADQRYDINDTSVLQARPPDRLRGRVGAAVRVSTAGTAPAAALLGGACGERLGLRPTAVVAGLGVVVAFVWLVLSPVRSLRTRPEEPEAAPPGDASSPAAGPARPAPDAPQPVAGHL
jgi:hypothetical protein